MDTNDHTRLRSGEPYTLSVLFGDDCKIVIPDLQRDYCWGCGDNTKDRRELVSVFVRGLVELYMNGKAMNLGMVYGYEDPPGSGHIQLCDGQQRITTLFLLIGMLYRECRHEPLRNLLMSDYELLDDREPKLLYEIRQSTLYFMSDLVCDFFISGNGELRELKKSAWYYSSYDNDLSIIAIIGALEKIDNVLKSMRGNPDWDIHGFCDFLTGSFTFTYYDLCNRRNGEATFVMMNTAGEPLTFPQNLKALLFAANRYDTLISARWEEMSRWFWKNRDKSDPDVSTTSDDGMNEFLRWVAIIRCGDRMMANSILRDGKTYVFPVDTVRFDDIWRCFVAYRRVWNVICGIGGKPAYEEHSVTDCFSLFPAILYADRFDTGVDAVDISGIWNYFFNLARYQNVSVGNNLLHIAMDAVMNLKDKDIVGLLDLPDSYAAVIPEEEAVKLSILRESMCRKEIERMFYKAQNHQMLNGRLRDMIMWCIDGEGKFDHRLFREYFTRFDSVWNGDIDCRSDLDDVRRALLTFRSEGFPLVRKGETMFSLCWTKYEWRRLMAYSPDLIKAFLDRLRVRSVREMIAGCNDRGNYYWFIIKDKKILGRCGQRIIIRLNRSFIGVNGLEKNAMSWYIEQRYMKIDHERWSPLRSYGNRCLFTDHRIYNITIDFMLDDAKRMTYRIELFSRKDPAGRKGFDLRRIMSLLDRRFSLDRARSRFVANFADVADAMECHGEIQAVVSSLTCSRG